ncbi:MAG: hypothetical protein R3313_04190 [Candidatus Saccharimonadales bacterium]|nr:hypothetical protein [Candidatus Saccharimonadales bacterium]
MTTETLGIDPRAVLDGLLASIEEGHPDAAEMADDWLTHFQKQESGIIMVPSEDLGTTLAEQHTIYDASSHDTIAFKRY